ncbi:MAG: FGGY-family carbohydrate kinase [Chloroflexota bacterium]|nr:FGGY-family carbohydrate kinase [Chloroflexota bacterium]
MHGQFLVYALEGAVFVAGAAVQWLRDELRVIGKSADVEVLAARGSRDSGVVVVPAFVGLGAPHWDPDARGAIVGLTLGSGVEDIALATVDAMAYQVADVLEAMALDAEGELGALRVDGGAAVNDALLQFQADILRVPVERPRVTETTALGAAFLAGLGTGFWSSTDEVAATWQLDRRFEPQMDTVDRDRLVQRWRHAVERAKGWASS